MKEMRWNNMDKITIKDLEVFCHHGVLPEETTLGQKFVITADFFLSTSKAGKTDDLEYSLSYAEAGQFIKEFMEQHTYKLLEAVVENLAEALLLRYPFVEKVKLELKKPWAPIGLHVDTVAVTIRRSWHTCYLAIGSNIGDTKANFERAIQLLNEDEKTRVTKMSDFIVTPPYGGVPQDDFLNGALEIKTLRTPEEVLELIGIIEQDLKRVREIHWGPRTIDLDIIFYDDIVMQEERLTIPHKEMAKRDFVLQPLCQIAPTKVHPILGATVGKLYQDLIFLQSQED